ncbi:MAG: SDR family NAD(P)-dependent oxidoreductase [Chloroflexi bacterium]|nr:SDR family NAD(P)-dependent oxidoreductase [Chloroflexota bacterium]
MSETDLQGKTVLVVGSETELGRAIAIGLAEASADVAIASLTSDTKAEFAINSALNEVWALGRKGLALAIDASDAEMLRRGVEQAESELGTLDLVVTIGGVATEALAGRDTIELAPDAAQDEALTTIKVRLQGG